MIQGLFDKLSEQQQKCVIELMIAMTDHPTTSPLRAIGEARKLHGSQGGAHPSMDFITTALFKFNEMKKLPNR